MSQFAEWCVVGSVTKAITCLVQESLFQGPVSLDLNIESKLPPHSVQLFLQISKLLLTTTEKQHTGLANGLQVLIDLIPPDLREWPTMPSTMAGFKAHVINPTNKHSLVSILPVPMAYMLSDRSHAYCCLQEIAAFILLCQGQWAWPQYPFVSTNYAKATWCKTFFHRNLLSQVRSALLLSD